MQSIPLGRGPSSSIMLKQRYLPPVCTASRIAHGIVLFLVVLSVPVTHETPNTKNLQHWKLVAKHSHLRSLYPRRYNMLRWTCRLRDALEARGFLSSSADSLVLSQIKEAEFVAPKGCPSEFRWETFWSCFNNFRPESTAVTVTLVYPSADAADRRGLVRAVNTRDSRSIRALNGKTVNDLGQRNIAVLWLSPTVFISGVKFRITDEVHDYALNFGEIRCYITQLPAFDQVAFDEPSPLPIDFFQHLVPTERFACIFVDRSCVNPKRFPADYIMRLMSTIPTKSFFLGGLLNSDELRHILSHPFQEDEELSFSPSQAPFDNSVLLEVLMALLVEAPYLRRIELPRQVFLTSIEESSGVWLELLVRSPALKMRYSYEGAPEPAVLNAISKIHQKGDRTFFYLQVDDLWEGGRLALATSIVHPFLDGRFILEHLRIQFSDEANDTPGPEAFHQVMQELASVMIACRSKHLCHFTVSLGMFDSDFNVDDDVDHEYNRNMHKIRQWDESIFPQLVLNQCNKQLTKVLGGRLLPRAISAINWGILYRKTTDHIPYDMSTANASVIFDLVKADAVKSEQH
jgi:hypothetical protein